MDSISHIREKLNISISRYVKIYASSLSAVIYRKISPKESSSIIPTLKSSVRTCYGYMATSSVVNNIGSLISLRNIGHTKSSIWWNQALRYPICPCPCGWAVGSNVALTRLNREIPSLIGHIVDMPHSTTVVGVIKSVSLLDATTTENGLKAATIRIKTHSNDVFPIVALRFGVCRIPISISIRCH
jgi:hypothetical protein